MRNFLWLLLLVGAAHGQVVQITGTVLDPNNVPYQNGSGVAVLVPQNQTWIINGTNPVPSPIPIAQLDSFGKFSISLTNTSLITPSSASPQWQFSFCSSKAVINPPICFTMTPMALTSSQDISTQIQAQSAVLPSSSSGLSSLTTTSPLTGCSSPCTSTATIGISNATTSALGVIELAGDFGGSATLPDVLNLSNVTNASLANSGLVHPSVTVTAGTGLSGGGTVALGGSVTVNIANQVSAGSCTNCNATINNQGQVTAFSNGGGSSPGSAPFYPFVGLGWTTTNGSAVAYGSLTNVVNTLGTAANIFPTATDSNGGQLSGAASASTSTVIGEDTGQGANYGLWGYGNFYRWSSKFKAGNTTNVRYWMGLTNFNTGQSGCAAQSPLNTTCFAANNPGTFSIAFRYSVGTDTSWQGVTQTQSGQTLVSTGVALDTNSHLFEFTNVSGTVTFYIDGTNVGTSTTNIPSSSASSSGNTSIMFWCGDNENTATAISAVEYWMTMTLK